MTTVVESVLEPDSLCRFVHLFNKEHDVHMVLEVGVPGDVLRLTDLSAGKVVGFLDRTLLLFVLLLLAASALLVVGVCCGQVGL